MKRKKKVTKKATSVTEFAKQSKPIELGKLTTLLRRQSLTLDEISQKFKTTNGAAIDAIQALKDKQLNLHEMGGAWSIPRTQPPPGRGPSHKFISEKDGSYRFGLISDTHHGSVHCREDVVDELYDWFAAEGINRVYHCGNWIEGEHRFNKFELIDQAHGMQSQIDYFIKKYPVRKDITTYYVAGDDHEGWYYQREGVDVGRLLQSCALQEGRKDLFYLGYKEAFVTLEHAQSKETARMLVDHPGGGTAHAISWRPQQLIKNAQPGEKPAVWAFGHWHKHGYFIDRNVHILLVPCTKDVDTWARKKGLLYTIGGLIVELEQDIGGAITGCTPRFKLWMDRGYYNHQYTPDRSTAR